MGRGVARVQRGSTHNAACSTDTPPNRPTASLRHVLLRVELLVGQCRVPVLIGDGVVQLHVTGLAEEGGVVVTQHIVIRQADCVPDLCDKARQRVCNVGCWGGGGGTLNVWDAHEHS